MQTPDLLQENLLRAHLVPDIFSVITLLPCVDSTNSYLLEQPLTHGHVCLAEQQTQGRGRQGRVWESPGQSNIYLSVLWEVPHQNLSGLSLAVGLSTVLALQQLQIPHLKLKWPNDILYEGRKLGGILVEVRERKKDSVWVVIGIGINVQMPELVAIDQPWIDIAQIQGKNANLSRNLIAATILNHLQEQLTLFAKLGLTAVHHKWQSLDALYDKTVTVKNHGDFITGKAQGINAQGELLILHEGELLAINSGEILDL